MPVDLPFYKSDAGSPRRRPRANKRIIAIFGILALFFIFFLNTRLATPLHSSEGDDHSTESHFNQNQHKENPIDTGPIPVPNNNIQNKKPGDEGQPKTIPSPHSNHHSSLLGPLLNGDEDDIVINNSSHYSYIVVIASDAESLGRRNLIREKYFGLRNNLTPCMRFNTDVMYKFWIYGGPPPSKTPLRRQYEAEKMEWNDLEEQPKGVEFEQTNILEWANTKLLDQGITYDYLIVQDINTFVQLSTIKRELDNGVISDGTDSPVAISSDAPTNLVWGRFSGDATDKNAFVIGAAAVKCALDNRQSINAHELSSSQHLLTNMYSYYQAEGKKFESMVDEKFEPEQAAETMDELIPRFVREDGPEDTQRFIHWENNVESVHAEDIVIVNVYQDAEFAELARWTRLKSVAVCHSPKAVFQPPVTALDDDEDANELDDIEDFETNVRDSKPEHGPSIALVTSSFIYEDSCMEPSATLSAANKRRFAEKHGHAFVARSAEFAQQKGRKTVWGKIDAIEKVLPKYDWIFWMDMDAVILNSERSLDALLADIRTRFPDGDEAFNRDINLIAARPTRDPMVNAGVFFLRNSPWSMRFLRDLQGMVEWYNKGSAYEQGAMWDLMNKESNKKHVYLLDRDDHTFNTFPRFYKQGDFIVHFAPDKCPNDATLKGLEAAKRIENGEIVASLDEE